MEEDLSPLKKEFDNFDLKHIDWFSGNYQMHAMKQPIEEMNELWLKEKKWRFKHRRNSVVSVHSTQGEGKSLFANYEGLLNGSVYGVPFSPSKNVFFEPEDLDSALSKAQYGETFLEDEQRERTAGILSRVLKQSLADYENQLRDNMNNLIFASPELQDHTHFFVFEVINTYYTEKDGKPYPKNVVAILKTPRFTNRLEFVWRGRVCFPVPNEEYWKEYSELKHQHTKELQSKSGGYALTVLDSDCEKLMKEYEKDFLKTTPSGEVKPINAILMEALIYEKLGSTSKYTVPAIRIMKAKIKKFLDDKYLNFNADMQTKAKAIMEQRLLEKQKLSELEKQRNEERQNQRMELQRLKFEESKRQNDLRQKLIELKQKRIDELAQEKQLKKQIKR